MRGRIIASVGLVAGLFASSLGAGAGPAGAALPAHPAPCSFSLGALSTQGAAGTQEFQVGLVPGSPGQSCVTSLPMSGFISDAAGHVPAGIASDGGTATVVLLFTAAEYPPPVVNVAWHAYCTTAAQPVFLHLSGGGHAAVYPLGNSRPCSQGPAAGSTVDPPRVLSPDPALGLAPVPGGGAYRIATVAGSVLLQPGAVIEAGDFSATPFVGIAADPAGVGFWLATSDGGVYSFNGASFFGSAHGLHLAQPVVGITATPTGHGYWLVAGDGGVFGFGDAHFYGSAGGIHLAAPVVGMAATADGGGYWLVASDGGVFTYGDAHFYGSAGSVPLHAPIVGMAADHVTGGYWLGASDGGVFTYNAHFYGSAGGLRLSAPVAGVTATPDSGGYWLVGADGGVFTYGDATFHGTGAGVVAP